MGVSGRIQPKKALGHLPERQKTERQMIIYICPTPECLNYYAAPDFVPGRSDITRMQFHRNQNDGRMKSSHPRIECPFCRERGMSVNRIPYLITEVVLYEEARVAASMNMEEAIEAEEAAT